MADLESQKVLLEEINSHVRCKNDTLENQSRYFQSYVQSTVKKADELGNQNGLLHKFLSKNSKSNTSTKVAVCIPIALSLIFIGFLYTQLAPNLAEADNALKTRFLIQDLRGDTVNTWISWHLSQNQPLHVKIKNSNLITSEKINIIKDAILSGESIKLDDSLLHKGPLGTSSLYYKGWTGALEEASQNQTKFYIPTKFEFIDSGSSAEGDVEIELTDLQDSDGLSGYTKSITDQNQILKSHITIYDVKSLSNGQLGEITRHEFGHALGLAHSSAPEDLMHATIQTEYPYISGCDISAINSLYDGNSLGKEICRK